MKGHLALLLHAHLPYVRHPEHDDFLEEHWLFEAITESYIPLIQSFERLLADRVPFRISWSVSPSLAGMLADPLLMTRYERRLEQLIELAAKEVERTRAAPELHRLAVRYLELFTGVRETFVERHRRSLIGALRGLAESGAVELLTSAATHAYLPLMNGNRPAIHAQVEIGAAEHERHFGRRPRGMWLPECAYEPGLDEVLAAAGIRYFVLDHHGVLHATPRPRHGAFRPIACPSGVAAFGRDLESAKQVWSSKEGYPGDYAYRDFYRDVGWDLDYETVRPYLPGDRKRTSIGIKYHRITGPTDEKELYDPAVARARAAEHAGNFVFNRQRQVEHLRGVLGREPVLVAAYDAELFGHWWHEGPLFLEQMLRKIAFEQDIVEVIHLHEVLEGGPRLQRAVPSASSWGYKGYHEVWLDDSNQWIYPHLHQAAERMVELAGRHGDPAALDPLRVRALNQAARELLLAQHSDWAFIMKSGTMVEYAERRTRIHLSRFNRLFGDLAADRIDPVWLDEVERRDNIFPALDYRVYQP